MSRHIQWSCKSYYRPFLLLLLPDPIQNGSCSGFVFSEHGCQTAFYGLGTRGEENIWGVQRGGNPLGSGSSNRGESIPVGIGYPKGNSVALGRGIQRGQRNPWHTIFRQESLVCYTFVEQMAAGIVAHPEKCGHSCGVLAGKVAPCGAA